MSLLHKSEPYAHAKYIQIAADFTVDNQTVIILAMPPFTILNHGIHMKHTTKYQYIHRHHLHMLHIFIIHLDCPLKSSSTSQTQVCFTLSSYMSEVRKNNYHKANYLVSNWILTSCQPQRQRAIQTIDLCLSQRQVIWTQCEDNEQYKLLTHVFHNGTK